ncbi:MAG TPA: TetR/AcrR family transcriptional regulator [Deltaproteobacteria bacterium]|nr:TetR/AcrR family transcriptional regulator [Deltaproteobacteria bacterium]
MPKRQRTPEEVEAIKERILRQAVDLMNRVGFQEFSMRRLAREIKVTPPTLYSYFHDKDELYLCILTEGFSRLYDLVLKAYGSSAKPLERMKAIARAYMDFGLNCAHFYNLMFTWHVPKYNDYLGTRLEPTAQVELETSLQVASVTIQAIKECVDEGYAVTEGDARFLLVYYWSTLHGYIAGTNNTLLTYMHENPSAVKERMLSLIDDGFVREILSCRVSRTC